MSIRRLLVANRGEIARRVFRTCRELGIETVAVHSDADATLAFVAEADVAVRLPGNTPGETYLRGDLVVEAALKAGADAVHPGYGFLSESAELARRVRDAGLTWVGPDPESIEAMGSKVAAKKLMAEAGVPVLAELAPAAVTEADLPVLVKASAGGGGRGMRVVRRLESLSDEVARAEAEAASAFGDGTVFVEPYVERGRHVEVQLFGDATGRVTVLGDRDCSVQRRHQKVVEEAPAPGLPDDVRAAMHDAARKAGEAISYRGAGTVEFLYDEARGQFWFLEMNTRLQVEHPVTECVTGLDLVALQVAAAEGVPVVLDVGAPRGHAVEVRLYAEDPAADWQPQSGRLHRLEVPDVEAELSVPVRHGVRLDTGFRTGDEVGTHYDAMLAKVIAWGPTRDAALRRLAGVLRRAHVHGIHTNRELLVEVLQHPGFVAAELGTDFLDRHELGALSGTTPSSPAQQALACFAAAVATAEQAAAGRPVQRAVPVGWRNVVSAPHVTTFDAGGTQVEVGWHGPGSGASTGYRFVDLHGEVEGATVGSVTAFDNGWRVVVDHDGVRLPHDIHLYGDRVDVEAPHGHVALTRMPRFTDPADQLAEGSLVAPMPGSVVAVRAAQGDRVEAGATILVLEAMKMQHTIAAPRDGVVESLPVTTGDQVSAGDVLAVIHPDQENA
jgi:propionyl-CoA carboxylase alpha chain